MTDGTTRAEAHTLVGACVLDAVSDTERRIFEEHLACCTGCAQEIAELRETTVLLARATAEEPPARLRDRVLAAVACTRQLPPEIDDHGKTSPAGTGSSSGPEEPANPPIGISGASSRWLRRWWCPPLRRGSRSP